MSLKDVMKRVKLIGIITAICLLMAIQTNAAEFVNGDFDGFTGNTNTWNSQVPPGWTTTGGTPDVFDKDTNLGGMVWLESSTGGDFLHGIGWQGVTNESAVQDALTGLVMGQEYEISFEQSIVNSAYSYGGGYWNITFGTETQSSEAMDLPAYGEAFEWDWQTMIFTATAEEQSLYVSAFGSVYNVRADLGIDGFYLGAPGENPDNPDYPDDTGGGAPVPEPATILLFGLGLLGLAGVNRKKQ